MSPKQAVNRPTDMKQKEKDVNNKLQWYGIYNAFANGKVPSNKQIDIALNSALASKPLSSPSKQLSAEGQKLAADIKDVIEAAKLLVLTKNDGNLLQDFIWQTQQITGGNASAPNAPVDKTTAQQHGNEALEGLRTLGTLIISNGQFRKLLNDATILLRDVAGDAATKAASRVNPSHEQLNQIDLAAEDNTWHDVPDVSRDKIMAQVKQRYSEQKPFGRAEVEKAANDAAQAAHPTGARDPSAVADLAFQEHQQGINTGLDAPQGINAGVGTLAEQARQNVPEETQEQARSVRERTRAYLLQEKMPKERREQTIWRLKKMVVEIQGHQDYMRAIDTLLRLAEEYTGHSRSLVSQGRGAVKGAHTDDSLQMAESDLKTLIERFANNTSLDDLFEAINAIYKDADRDEELKNWFKQLNRYIRRCLKEQGFIMQDEATDEWNILYDRGHFLLRERYRNHTDRIVDEFKFLGSQFDADPQNQALSEALQKLFRNIGLNESGKAAFKPHLIKDLTDIVLPGIFENVRYIPIPRIEYTDPMVDVVVENLVVESDNLAPNVLEFGSDNYWRWGRKKISNKNKNKFMLSVSGVQMDLRDVSYYIKRKQGFPAVTDQGNMDIFLGGQGLSFKVQMESADPSDKAHFFKITKIDVDVKHLDIKLKKSKHKLIFSLFKPLLFRLVRPALQKVVETQIKQNVTEIDAMAYAVRQEAERAAEEARRNPDPENVQNIYQRYVSAVRAQLLKGQQKVEETVSDRKVNMAVTQHDSIFPNVHLPGGISSKATEYKDLAGKGEKWESPVFSVGSAKETSNLPRIEAVTRRPHQVTQGGLRGSSGSTGQPLTGQPLMGQPLAGSGPNAYANGYGGAQAPLAPAGVMNGSGGLNATQQQQTMLGEHNPVLTGTL